MEKTLTAWWIARINTQFLSWLRGSEVRVCDKNSQDPGFDPRRGCTLFFRLIRLSVLLSMSELNEKRIWSFFPLLNLQRNDGNSELTFVKLTEPASASFLTVHSNWIRTWTRLEKQSMAWVDTYIPWKLILKSQRNVFSAIKCKKNWYRINDDRHSKGFLEKGFSVMRQWLACWDSNKIIPIPIGKVYHCTRSVPCTGEATKSEIAQ